MAANERVDHEFQEFQTGATRGFLPILWQRKALIVLGILLGLAGGFLVYWQRTPVYQSSALVLVIKKNSQPLPVQNDPRMGFVDDFMQTHVVLLKSPVIIDKAVKKKDLGSLRTFEGNPDHVGTIISSLTVSRDIKEIAGSGPSNNIVLIAFRGPVADDCGKIISAIIESYQDYLDVKFRNVSDQTLDLIKNARDVLEKKHDEAYREYFEFIKTSPVVVRTKDGGNVVTDVIADLEKDRYSWMIRMEKLKERIRSLDEAIKNGKGGETLAALYLADAKSAAYNPAKALAEALLPLKVREMELLQNFDKDHPSVKAVRANIAQVEEHYKKLEASGAGELKERDPAKHHLAIMRAELSDAEMNHRQLEMMVEKAKSEVRKFGEFEMKDELLRNKKMGLKALYDQTIKRLEEINIVRDTGGFDASPLSHSGIGVKVAPSAFQMIMGGLMLGLLAGIGLAFLADLTDKGFRSPDEVRRRLKLPLLGHVPLIRPDPETTKKIETGEIQTDPLLSALYRPKSIEAEAYRAVRTALLFSIQGEGHRVIQVTSPNKSDGKSLLISNLAISAAQADKRVLLIDADCRRPRQHKIFAVSNSKGLVNVIRQEHPWGACAQPTTQDGLWVMPSGPLPHNPAELLASPQFRQTLETLRKEFDLVLVDTPPLLAVTDPCIVAGKVDGVVLALRLSRQGRPQAERACDIMLGLHVNILGIVVNGVSRQSGAGLYSTEHYDYAESYAESEESNQEDGYYYQYLEESPEAGDTGSPQAEVAAGAKKSNGGLLSRIFSRKS